MSSRSATGGTRVTASSATNSSTVTGTAAARMLKAQQQSYRQYLRWAKANPKAAAAAKRKTATRGAPAPATVLPSLWVTGGNDTEQTCVTVAIANCVLMQTGKRPTDAEVIALHRAGTQRSPKWTSFLRLGRYSRRSSPSCN